MSTLREAAIGAMGALETARNGLAWYRDRYPESTDGSDDEAAGDIDAAIDALRAELVKPDAPTVEDEPAPQMPEALRDSLQRRCVEWGVYWRAPDAHGVDLTHEQALELLRDALGVEVEIAAAPRPAPAEPQGAEAPQEIKSLRDRIIEGELELDGTHPPTLMFLMAEHWKAVATEHYAKAKDYDRLKHELRLSRTAPAPRPAGGEPVAALIRHRSLQTEARIAHDGCDHYSDWSDWEPATVQHALAVTDPARNTHPLLWEARLLVDCQPQPAAQQEPLFWYRPRSDGLYEGPIHNAQIERARKESGGWVPLYTQAAIDAARMAGVRSVQEQTAVIVRAALELLESIEGETPFTAEAVRAFKRVFGA